MAGGDVLQIDPTGTFQTLAQVGAGSLAASGVTAGTYGDSTHVAQVVIDAKGRVTSASAVAISASSGVASFAAQGQTALTGAVTISGGSNVTLTQTGQNVSIAAAGGGGGGSELDYVENTAGNFTVTATSEATAQTFIAGNAHTYDGATRIKIEFWCGAVTLSGGTGVPILLDGSTSLGWFEQLTTATWGTYGVRFLTPSAGAHTYKIAAWKTAGAFIFTTGAGGSGAQMPGWYRITTA